MDNPGRLVHWVIDHWKQWGITATIVGITNIATWFLAQRKEWKEARRTKREKKIDAKVLEALESAHSWSESKLMTGSGIIYVRSLELAQHLSMDKEAVADCLERLESRARVERGDGSMSDPSPVWRIIPR
jgi:type II secretory pathway component PulF